MRKVDNVQKSYPGLPHHQVKLISSKKSPFVTLLSKDLSKLKRKRKTPLSAPLLINSKWRTHLSPDLPTSDKFFHLTQLLSREQGGFILSLGLVKPNKIKISTIDFVKSAVEAEESGMVVQGGNIIECEAERYWGKTVFHRMLVKWGEKGVIDCTRVFSVS